MKRLGWIALGFAALLPFLFGNNFLLVVACQMAIAAIFAVSLNVLLGYGGLFTFGQASFYGLSAYLAALLLVDARLPMTLVILVTLVAVPIVAVGFGAIALRATGISFVMITLALGQLFWAFAMRSVDLTRGENGIPNIPSPSLGIEGLPATSGIYFIALACLTVCVLAVQIFMRSNLGAAFQGSRDQPKRMAALGYNVKAIQLVAFAFSGFWAALAGLLHVFHTHYVNPHVFLLTESAETLLMVIVGGVASVTGPIVGAVLVIFFKSVVSMYFQYWLLITGIAFIVVVILVPDGLVDGTRRVLATRKSGGAKL